MEQTFKLGDKTYKIIEVEEVKYDYLAGHIASGLKVGDMVKVVRKAEGYERGWKCWWPDEKNSFVGGEYEINLDCGAEGFLLNTYLFPYFVLEKVEEKKMTYEDVLKEIHVFFLCKETGKLEFPNPDIMNSFIAKSKLANVAFWLNEVKYKNMEWSDNNECYNYCYNKNRGFILHLSDCTLKRGVIEFKSKQIAREAKEILGEETVKMALK